ncbi:MAG TPA: family 20 glycosylhydrolase [Eudoraea sp.]|nr:family 20 glycosylhydrolase [Eudoraea sp.]
MKKQLLFLFFALLMISVEAQSPLDSLIPVRGLCIAAPRADGLTRFTTFISEELTAKKVNTLILRVDYGYQYSSHPELVGEKALSMADVKSIVAACKKAGITLIPQINLLGHQSWHSSLSKLLEVYPEFDETPHISLPEEYKWPNEDGLYCKSYCPLHPGVHDIVFELVDEILDVFESDHFHAGMDEVFYIGNPDCPRCGGKDKAELFAGEVVRIRNHLALRKKKLWIWGDRLIDGKTTGIGMWEASMNSTHRAIDLIPKDIVICDWHYERPDQTPVYFATKGFDVVTCPWRNPAVAGKQLELLIGNRESSTQVMKQRFRGVLQTIWTSADNFLDMYYGKKPNEDPNGDQIATFNRLFEEIGKLNN